MSLLPASPDGCVIDSCIGSILSATANRPGAPNLPGKISHMLHVTVAARRLSELSLERATHDVTRAESNGKSGREHDAAKEDAECQQQNVATDARDDRGPWPLSRAARAT